MTHNTADATPIRENEARATSRHLSTHLGLPLFAALALAYIALDLIGISGPAMATLKAAPIAVLGWLALRLLQGATRTLALVALLFSALGDILLATPFHNHFVFGLGAFLVAQLVYAINFLSRADFRTVRFGLRGLPIILAAVGLAQMLLPAAGELAPAVGAYLMAILTMALAAAAHRGRSGLLLAGALCFMLSDALIGVNRFLAPVPLAGTAIMVTYYLAQLMLLYGLRRARA